MYQPTEILTNEEEIRAIVPDQFSSQTGKVLDHIDDLCRVWIEASTFLTMATVSAAGRVDVSPKGDPAGFVRVVDDKTLAIPDRPGNHRFDSFLNILETGRIGLVFLVPHRNEVVRVNGSAQVVTDAELMETMSIKGRVPVMAVLVRVEEAFYHCGNAVIRSRLWHPEEVPLANGLPTYAEALKAHGTLADDLDDLERRMKNNDENRLYDE